MKRPRAMLQDAEQRRAAVLRAILAHPEGAPRRALAAEAGVSGRVFWDWADKLRSAGLVACVGVGPATVWGPPSLAWAPKRVRSAEYLRRRARDAAARRRMMAERRQIEALDDPLPVCRVIVPASQAAPLPKPCAASVWELAA